MPKLSNSERETMQALRSQIARLKGSHATANTPTERVRMIRRHLDSIEADCRVGMFPAPMHLTAIAAHALILHGEARDA